MYGISREPYSERWHCRKSSPAGEIAFVNSADKRSDAYSAEQVLLNKQQIWCGGAYPDCYLAFFSTKPTPRVNFADSAANVYHNCN